MSTFTDLIVTTLSKWSDTLADNVTANSCILARLKAKNAIVKEDGGSVLEEDIMYAENGTFKWYSGFELLDISDSEVLTAALYDWKQANANIVISGLQMRNNSGSTQKKHNLLKSKMLNGEITMKNNVAKSIFSDGTGNGGKELTGLQALVSDNPASSTVGGIDAAENPFWRNQAYSLSTDGGVSGDATPADVLAAMDEMMLRTTRNSDRPDIIVSSADLYKLYKQATQNIKRIVEEKGTQIGDASFTAVEYEGVPVVYDSFCPASHMYFLNTDYLKLHAHKDAYFTLDKERLPVNQDAKVFPMIFQGNLTCSNRNLQGVITA